MVPTADICDQTYNFTEMNKLNTTVLATLQKILALQYIV